MKVNFLLSFKEKNDIAADPTDLNTNVGIISVPGELIDVAINNYEDSRNVSITDKFATYFADYNFINTNSRYNNNFSFKSYSLDGLISDLFEMVYIDNNVPWDAKKYNKRVKRILFFSMIKILSTQADYDLLLNIQNIFTRINEADINNIIDRGNYFTDLLAPLDRDCENIILYKILSRHENMFNYINAQPQERRAVNNQEFIKYYEIIKDFCRIMVNVQEVIRNVCSNNIIGKIDVNAAKFNQIHQIGGIYDKYIKYKTKYYKSKNQHK
jgi:hypothetical protein